MSDGLDDCAAHFFTADAIDTAARAPGLYILRLIKAKATDDTLMRFPYASNLASCQNIT